nr:metallophosphoesterase [Haloferula sp. BvORR071]
MQNCDLTWLHLSDFHVGKDSYAQISLFRKILREVGDNERKPDFVFITGDIANKGRSDEFKLFDAEFIVPLQEMLGDDYFKRVFIIPGNHDVDRSKARAIKRSGILSDVPNFLDPTAEGREEREPLLARFAAFDECKWYLETEPWVTSNAGVLSRKFELAQQKVGVLCINTAWFCGPEPEKEKLTAGIEMVEAGLRDLGECDLIFTLGHHPLDWWLPSHAKQVDAILRRSNTLYLCGHLHKTEFSGTIRGVSPLLSLQAGCCFSARNDEIWVPRLVWGGYTRKTNTVALRPKKWHREDDSWILDTEAVSEDLRRKGGDFWEISMGLAPKQTSSQSAEKSVAVPDGWVVVNEVFLAEKSEGASEERVLQYFEGRVPEWEDILAGKIAKRGMVADLVSLASDSAEQQESKLTLLLGAGGEGKSTVLLQTLLVAYRERGIRVLWRRNPEKGLPSNFLVALAAAKESWLIAADEADNLVGDIYAGLRAIPRNSKINILLTARDTDWINAGGNDHAWGQLAKVSERRMKGLEEQDAESIVESWTQFGSRGLGRLTGASKEDAVAQLMEAARIEATVPDGAFLGAMLRVRVGVALKDHVASLMGRLETRKIQELPGKTLLDAFAYIAIPHALNVLFLSKPVLARALGLDESRLRRRILGPLGEEAAASAYGQYVLTRHRAIAEAASEIALSRFDFEVESVLMDLVRAAIIENEEGHLVPNLKEWRFLSSRFFDEGNQSLGVVLANAALATDPKNSFLAVKLASLYRSAGQAELSAMVFRKSSGQAKGNRAFYTEWATCEGFISSRATSVWLHAVSLADGTEMRPPSVKDVGFGLSGLLNSFIGLYDAYQLRKFSSAAGAAYALGLRLTLSHETYQEFARHLEALNERHALTKDEGEASLAALIEGIEAAYEIREIELGQSVPTPYHLSYDGLRTVLKLKQL